MADICTDNRFELIEKYKKNLIESTNIETSQDEMKVLDNLLFRFWQMGWLDRLEQPERKTYEWLHDLLQDAIDDGIITEFQASRLVDRIAEDNT